MMKRLIRWLAMVVVPAGAASVLYYLVLGYRRDYLGHFAAGYGGTLCACVVVMAALEWLRFRRLVVASVLPCVLVCIAGGAVAEATVFRFAAFDPIDFCNQSLGAVFAGYAAVLARPRGPDGEDCGRPAALAEWGAIIVGILFLYLGYYFALA